VQFKDFPIQKKLLRIVFLINGTVLLVTCVTFFIYEYYIFRKSIVEKLSTIGKIISANSSAALAFDSPDDAKEILSAIKSEPDIVAAYLYDKKGTLFAQYNTGTEKPILPVKLEAPGYRFVHSRLEGFEPVMQDNRQLGTLYIRSHLGALYNRLRLYGLIVATVLMLSFVLTYLLVRIMKKGISAPIHSLAKTAQIVSEKQDYSIRAVKMGKDELGSLTDAFNHMLDQIQEQNQSLKEFNQTLEQKVSERTRQLESVNRELESFSYSVSHDLRAPLRAIIGFTAILEEDYTDKLDQEAMRITTVIKKNTVKMGQLIDDLLAFSRISRQDVAKTNLNMTSIVNEVKDDLSTQYDISKIQWAIQPLPTITANTNLIRQVWVNLMSNAVKYSSKKENPYIEIGSFLKDKQTAFFVRDNGVGFDQKYSDKLFKVFQRLHKTEEFEGTGIGLALVEKIVARQGGDVWVDAEPGKGACFYFSLPL